MIAVASSISAPLLTPTRLAEAEVFKMCGVSADRRPMSAAAMHYSGRSIDLPGDGGGEACTPEISIKSKSKAHFAIASGLSGGYLCK